MLSLLLSKTHRRKRNRPRAWQKMPWLVLICFYSYSDRTHKDLSVMEPLIESDVTLKRAADTKAVLKELQDDLAACMAFSIWFSF